MTSPEQISFFVKSKAQALGFEHCGISKAAFLEDEAPRLEDWLNQNMHGQMSYMANYFDKRLDPTKLVDGAKTVISLIYNYAPKKNLDQGNSPKIAKYAYGKDYHFVIKDKLKIFLEAISLAYGNVNGRVFVDSAPIMERAWAAKSGIGWIGKNSLLLNREMGSFFFLAEIIVDLDMAYDGPVRDYCGTCTKCMDACPTDAIPTPYVVDGSKCISYFTIELKEEIPSSFRGKFEDWIFGCDICQDVCPWNKFSHPHQEPAFEPPEELQEMSRNDWEEMTEVFFKDIFKKSPLKRTKFAGIKRNVAFTKSEKKDKI